MKIFQFLKSLTKRKREMTTIKFKLEDSVVERIKSQYGELLSIDDLIKEIIVNTMNNHDQMKELAKKTAAMNADLATITSSVNKYAKFITEVVNENKEETKINDLTESPMQILQTPQPILTEKVEKTPSVTQLDPNDPRVKDAMDKVRKKNLAAAEQRKSVNNSSSRGSVVASR